MKILSLSTRNFRLHAETDITFEPEGVSGIIGSNEAGKSTVLEAIVWCLFGGDTTRGTKAGLRWNRAPARQAAKATLRFEVGGKVYCIERTESNAKLVEEAGVNSTVIAAGTKPVNDHVPTVLGMNHAEFSASFLCQQNDLKRISTMLPTERVAFIRQVLGMGRIDAALAACRKRKGELAEERRGLEAGLGSREPLDLEVEAAHAEVARCDKTLLNRQAEQRVAAGAHEDAAAALAASATRKAEHDTATRALESARSQQEAATLEIAKLENRVQQEQEARAQLEEAGPKLARIPELRKERDALVGARAAVSERKGLEERMAALEGEIDGPNGLRDRIADAEKQVGLFDPEAYQAASQRAEKAGRRLEKLQGERLTARAQKLAEADAARKEGELTERRIAAIEKAGREADCPTCLRALGEAFDAVLTSLRDHYASACRREAGCEDAAAELLNSPSDDELEAEVERDEATREVARQTQLQQDARLGGRQAKEWRAQLETYEKGLETVRARLRALPQTPFDAERLTAVEADLKALEALDASLAGARGLVARMAETVADLGAWTERRGASAEVYNSAANKIMALDFDAERHTHIADVAARAQKAAEESRVALARAEGAAEAAGQRLVAAEAALADYKRRGERLEMVAAEHLAHERTSARLADFRVAIASTIRPETEELMSGFVHLLTDGRHEAVALDEEFGVTLYESGVPMEVVSGGCENIAALAMRLTLSQMIAERAGHPLSLLILDEPFDSIDETRRGNVLALIRRLRAVFEQVVVISHVGETRDAVDHVVELEFDEVAGMTRVVGAPAVAAVA